MNPTEWLRSITHRAGSEELAYEAATALEWFAEDPRTLVVACRRLLAHHPTDGRLWWICSTVLTAAVPVEAAREVIRVLDEDPTDRRLVATMPELTDGVVAIVGWNPAFDAALEARPDVEAVSVAAAGADISRLRSRRTDVRVRLVRATELAALDVDLVLVPAHAAGPSGALVDAGSGETLDAVPASPHWLIATQGVMLPDRIFTVIGSRAAETGAALEMMPLDRFGRLVIPRGVVTPQDAAASASCPIAPELLGGDR